MHVVLSGVVSEMLQDGEFGGWFNMAWVGV